MEIPRGYISSVTFPVPDSVPCSVNVTKGNLTIPEFYVTPNDNNLCIVEIPYAASHTEGPVEVELSFILLGQTYVKTLHVDVVTPYLELHEVKKIAPTFTDEECIELEAAARHVINAHTGQSFGYFEGTVTVMGNSDAALPMPSHTLRIDRIDEGPFVKFDRTVGLPDNYLGKGAWEITGTGWFLKRPSWSTDTWDGEWTSYSSDPIQHPDAYDAHSFMNDVTYTIKGAFGYEEVPVPVKQATELLVNDIGCADREYRERYLESIKSADWRIQFNSGAFRRTGNARADKLLSPFVVWRAKVI